MSKRSAFASCRPLLARSLFSGRSVGARNKIELAPGGRWQQFGSLSGPALSLWMQMVKEPSGFFFSDSSHICVERQPGRRQIKQQAW
jgi:hypothetical protein